MLEAGKHGSGTSPPICGYDRLNEQDLDRLTLPLVINIRPTRLIPKTDSVFYDFLANDGLTPFV